MSTPAPLPASASPLPPGITDPNYSPLPGRLGNLTVPQQHALDTFRKELKDEDAFVPERMDDAALLRSFPSISFSYYPNTFLPPLHSFVYPSPNTHSTDSCAHVNSMFSKPRRCSWRQSNGEKTRRSTSLCSACNCTDLSVPVNRAIRAET